MNSSLPYKIPVLKMSLASSQHSQFKCPFTGEGLINRSNPQWPSSVKAAWVTEVAELAEYDEVTLQSFLDEVYLQPTMGDSPPVVDDEFDDSDIGERVIEFLQNEAERFYPGKDAIVLELCYGPSPNYISVTLLLVRP